MNAQHFLPTALIVHIRFAGGVNSKIRPRPAGEILQRRVFGNAHPQVVVHREIKRRVERTEFLPVVRAEEHRLLRDVNVAAPQFSVIGLARREPADDLSMLIDEITIRVHQRHSGIFDEEFDRLPHCFGIVCIIRIEPREDVAVGVRKSFVDRIGLTLIRFADPGGNLPLIFFDDVHAAVGGATVNDDIFDVRVILFEHRADRRLKIGRLVKRRGDDGDKGQGRWFHTYNLLRHWRSPYRSEKKLFPLVI